MKKIFLILIIFVSFLFFPQDSFSRVTVTWTKATISVCPPSIFGTTPCTYPSLIDIFKKIIELIMDIAPQLLVILIILGGLAYLLSPIKPQQMIQTGHRYIQWAIYGYVILLLILLIFSFIEAILGGPTPPSISP